MLLSKVEWSLHPVWQSEKSVRIEVARPTNERETRKSCVESFEPLISAKNPATPQRWKTPASVDENQARSEVTRDNPVREGLDGRQDCLYHVVSESRI